ncbi:unnamed protein product, partial [Ectocarpus sp. 12 AP-2014]
GVVDDLDTGLAGDTNGDGVVDSMDEVVGGTPSPTAVGAGGGVTLAPGATLAPAIEGEVNGDGLVDSADTGIKGDTNGDGVVDDLDTGLAGDTNGVIRRRQAGGGWCARGWY